MSAPVRTCVGCRARSSKAELIRLVSKAAQLVVDGPQVEPGRGAYLHRSTDCAALAVRRRALGRALRAPGVQSDALPELVLSFLQESRGDA